MTDCWDKYPPRDWERIQKLGLASDVTSPETYALRVAQGVRLASATLSLKKEIVPSLDTIKGLHYLGFESVHPGWAGKFRAEGQEVRAGALICSNVKDIERDLNALRKEMLENPLKGSRAYKAEVLSFYHASFLAIHPFLDGNGRISRVILNQQCKLLLDHPLQQHFSRTEYTEALVRAQQEGFLGLLAKIIGTRGHEQSRSVSIIHKSPDKQVMTEELANRERELLKIRRKLGFVGTDIDEQYGLGGFPKPLTEADARAKAIGILRSVKNSEKTSTKSLSEQILKEDRMLIRKRTQVSEELLSIELDGI